MNESIANLLLRISSDPGDATTDLAILAAKLKALDKQDAEPEVDLSTASAETKLAAFRRNLASLSDPDPIDIEVNTFKADAQLALFRRNLKSLGGKDVDVSGILGGGGGGGGSSGGTVGGITKLRTELQRLSEPIQSVGGALAGIGGMSSRVSVSMGVFGARLSVVTAGLILMAGTIAIAVVGALGALVASLTLAVGLLGAMAVALAAAAGPMIAVLIPAAIALGNVLKVLKQEQQESAKAAQDKIKADQDAARYAQQHADAERSLSDALRNQARTETQSAQQVADAQRARQSATENLRDATVNAYREMADAIEAARDAELSLQRAKLSEDQANLGLREAIANLKNFRKQTRTAGSDLDDLFRKFSDVNFEGNTADIAKQIESATGESLAPDQEFELEKLILAVRDARLRQKEATDGVGDSETELSRAQQRSKDFQEQGIKASDSYTSALERAADARRALGRAEEQAAQQSADAQRAVEDARKRVGQVELDRQWQLQNDEMSRSKSIVASLTASEKSLLSSIREIWDAIQDAFGPASRAVIAGLAKGMKKVAPVIRSLKDDLTGLGEAMGGTIGGLFEQLASPQATQMFQVFIAGATQLAPLIGSIFGSMFDLISKIATAAMPYLLDLLGQFSEWLSGLSENTSIQDISGALAEMAPHLQTWLDLGGQIAEAFLGLLIAAAPKGLDLARAILDIATNLAKWANSKEGREQIAKWLDEAIPLAKDFASSVFTVVKWFVQAVKWTKAFFDVLGLIKDIIYWAIVWPIKQVDKLGHAIGNFIEMLVTKVAGWFGGFSVKVERAFDGIWEFMRSLPGKMFDFAVDMMLGFVNGMVSKAKDVAETIANVVTAPIDVAKGVLGIGSPSKVAMTMGEDLMKGYELGISGAAGKILQATTSAMTRPAVAAMTANGSGITIQKQDVHLPAAPGYDQMGDPRSQAVEFARELARRGGGVR